MNRLWFRITVSFSLLTFTLLVFLWFFVASVSENAFKQMTGEHLYENAQLVAQLIETSDLEGGSEDLQERIALFREPVSMRFTVIGTDGEVLADSENAPGTMENHGDRPEVQEVLEDDAEFGESIRFSETEGTEMMYVASPIYNAEGVINGIIRTSYPLHNIEDTMVVFWRGLAVFLSIILVIAAVAASILARSITRPVSDIIGVTKRLSGKDYSSRVHTKVSGEIGELAASVNDLATNLQNQMRALHENEQQLSTILSNMVSGVMLINQEGRILMINSAMEKFLGQHNQYIVGRDYRDVEDNLGLREGIATVFEENEKIQKEITAGEMTKKVFDAHFGPYYGNGWKQRGVIIVLHDITDIKRLENMRSDFVANVSHELKTPITSVKGFSETLLSGEVTDEETRRSFLQIIYDESERIDRLIRDLLHLSRIENKVSPLNIQDVDLVRLIHTITNTMTKAISEKNLEVTLPPSTESVIIEGDPDRLNQILLNLIANAITYTGEGGSIRVSIEITSSNVRVSVSDTGIGIPEEYIPRVFERFYRVDKARSRNSGGTGLGLAIVKHLVESHKGKIELDSVEGEGTTFTVIFPILQ
ncbi:two-component system histidine kinase PnpS [Salinicoccus halitifaciens]|uniref:Sensor protein kinase WalK n=1 Tax=Salinicoccus halitifaciens TaxID=1073415 RepID=A0ABV2EBE2_9STAP|nr:ATP-binding protein [Salinicoccus halitifaciens]MCD2138921.1 cell wall metabolism sensor histidine kinase WalK [Salinicoccus halitifaciens]